MSLDNIGLPVEEEGGGKNGEFAAASAAPAAPAAAAAATAPARPARKPTVVKRGKKITWVDYPSVAPFNTEIRYPDDHPVASLRGTVDVVRFVLFLPVVSPCFIALVLTSGVLAPSHVGKSQGVHGHRSDPCASAHGEHDEFRTVAGKAALLQVGKQVLASGLQIHLAGANNPRCTVYLRLTHMCA